MIHSIIMNTFPCRVIRSLRGRLPCFYSGKALRSSARIELPQCRPFRARARTISGPSLCTSIIASMGTGKCMLATLRGVSVSKPFSLSLQTSSPTCVFVTAYTVNHHAILNEVGLGIETYPYYNPVTNRLDFARLLASFHNAPSGSVFVLHACAHNPTGVDPTRDQWSAIADVMVEKGHFAFFDCAYQGFASGDLDEDAWAVREFAHRGIPMLVCQVGYDTFTFSLQSSPLRRARVADSEIHLGRQIDRVFPRMQGCTQSVSARCTSFARRRIARLGYGESFRRSLEPR
jgi:hypothetical protein